MNEINDRLELAASLAEEAGALARERFGSSTLGVETKDDGSFVTAADRDAERLIRDRLAELLPDDGILGEEHGESPGRSAWRWVLDPIDGTASFVHGVPLFGTMVGCEREGRPVLGAVAMPALDELVAGADGGTGWWRPAGSSDRRELKVSKTRGVERSLATWTTPAAFYENGEGAVAEHLVHRLRRVRGWSDCYAFVLLATGRVDAVVEIGLKVWDAAPVVPIIRAAGGSATGWNGAEISKRGDVLASNGHIHDELVGLIAEARGREG